ncbi:hypothetical protein VTJ04DRAFT_309 [Mycothermus thermophilus]|uniref:uncharacterized protein n=1 Tax=Humicola insolens TaxID=85995 RepID=UPI003742EAC2
MMIQPRSRPGSGDPPPALLSWSNPTANCPALPKRGEQLLSSTDIYSLLCLSPSPLWLDTTQQPSSHPPLTGTDIPVPYSTLPIQYRYRSVCYRISVTIVPARFFGHAPPRADNTPQTFPNRAIPQSAFALTHTHEQEKSPSFGSLSQR